MFADFFNLPYDSFWERLTNPLEFPKLYPNWVAHAEPGNNNRFRCTGPAGDSFTIVPRLNRPGGIIDFEVIGEDGTSEWSRSRLFPVQPTGCVLVHVSVRSEVAHLATLYNMDEDTFWNTFTQAVDADFEHARQLLEREEELN